MSFPIMSDDISKLTEALAKAKANFGPIFKNKKVNAISYSFEYADLASIEEAIRQPLMENGLTIMQPITLVEKERMLVTILSHSSGQWVRGIIPLSPHNGKLQDAGKEITYLRRYALSALLGISAEDDTDGGNDPIEDIKVNKSTGEVAPKEEPEKPFKASPDQLRHIYALIGDDDEFKAQLLEMTKSKSFEEILFTKKRFGWLMYQIRKHNEEKSIKEPE